MADFSKLYSHLGVPKSSNYIDPIDPIGPNGPRGDDHHMTSKFGRAAYTQWMSALPKGDSRRVDWDKLHEPEKSVWENVAYTVVCAHVEETLRLEGLKRRAANVPHFVTGMDARPSDASDRPGIPAEGHGEKSGFGWLEERIGILEKRFSALEAQQYIHHQQIPDGEMGVRCDPGIPDQTPDMTAQPLGKNPGQIAYEAYAERVEWKSIKGEPLPPWDDLQTYTMMAWLDAALAVRRQLNEEIHRLMDEHVVGDDSRES